MFKALNEDTSPFKNNFLSRIGISLFLLVATFVVNQCYINTALQNMRQQRNFATESAWLKSFDYQEALAAKARTWKPVNPTDAPTLVSSRINLFKEAGIELRNIRQQPASPLQKSKRLKFLTYNITVVGPWEKLVPVLNKFELDNSIVITKINISSRNNELTADIVFNVNHL